MKGIILAGGSGTRLYPITKGISKQLIPVYDKPMIYYPLSTLMLAGIRDILVISTPEYTPLFEGLLGDGSDFGINLSYKVQEHPNGLAEAFILGKEFIGSDSVCLILGDNIYYGSGLSKQLQEAAKKEDGATVFGYHVNDPERFGELEITDVNKEYLRRGKLDVKLMGRGYAWLDTGTHDSMLEAAGFISTIQKRQNLKVACLEEIAYRMHWISREKLIELAQPLKKNDYGQYLLRLAAED